LARYDGEFQAAREARASDLFGKDELPAATDRQRQEAIARCLSGQEGWRDAIRLLGGAFAPDKPPEQG
jgi:hypothetical protein